MRLLSAGLALALLASCDYSAPTSSEAPAGTFRLGVARSPAPGGEKTQPVTVARDPAECAAILESSIKLIQGAALQPGGDNFKLATKKLNQYFEGTPRSEYQIDSAAREYLETQLPRYLIQDLESPTWTLRDARHLEDCMMYYGIASRVGGTGDDLTRALRVFDWIVRQVQLVPAGKLGSRQHRQAFARPYDVLLRGMATESEGFWAERSWMFIAFCRQLGIDVGLITYSKGNVLEPLVPRRGEVGHGQAAMFGLNTPPRPAITWICAALIDGKAYLFDARVGLPVPGPDGQGTATLDQVLADPAILERMDLPGQSPYETSRASLLASPTKIGILIDSSPGHFTPKMKLLQRDLPGKDRTILFRSPAEQRDHFAQVLGNQFGGVKLWAIPIEVENRLFTDPQFVASIQQSLFLLRPEFPLVFARIKQLRGDFVQAIQEFVSLRFAEKAVLVSDKKTPIPKQVQEGLDVYSTYYLALAHLERNNMDQAELMFRKLLELLPEPGLNQPYYTMFRWGAHANLGRIYEVTGDSCRAIAHYTQHDPTMQYHGNLLRARELVWKDPMAALPESLPPAPKAFPTFANPAATSTGTAPPQVESRVPGR
jgi:hypothetical protein